MENLVTTSQAAEILKLSLQGIHYRIKKGQLKSTKKNGRVFVYLDKEEGPFLQKKQSKRNISEEKTNKESQNIVEVKNEQIKLLKKYIKWMKKQYQSEIHRLERNQDKIVSVFNSEIKLLQQAFHEMRSIYALEHSPKTAQTHTEEKKEITLKDFFRFMRQHNKTNYEIKQIIFDALAKNDSRFRYDKKINRIIIYKSDFLDLL